MTDQPFKLAAEFPEASLAAWRELAEAGLKGAPFDKKLVTRLADGLKLNPLYTQDDLDVPAQAIHGVMMAASQRAQNADQESAGWDIRQLHAHPDPKVTNAAILEDLENGATSVWLRLDAAARTGQAASAAEAGQDGVMLYCVADVAQALAGVFSNLAPVALDAGAAAVAAAALLVAHAGDEAQAARLAFNLDPVGTLVSTGSLPTTLEAAVAELGTLAQQAQQLCPQATVANVNAACWFNAGATDASELAIALATGVTYLRAMTAAGLGVEQAAARITFTTAIGTDFFGGIAKLRALRVMWQRVLGASGAESAPITINAIAAEHVLSKVDPWVNLLRTTVTSFAGGVGGADTVICLPFDHLLGLPDEFSRRLARNTQLILEEESNVHQVLDPAGGSWFIESLTRDLAQTAWTKFQGIEAAGGIVAKVLDGSLVADTAQSWDDRQQRLATRRDPLTGVSEFPNINEEAVQPAEPDLAQLRQQAQQRLTSADSAPQIKSSALDFAELIKAAKAGANIEQLFKGLYPQAAEPDAGAQVTPLTPHRLAESFEALRQRAQQHESATGVTPSIFLANIGRVAEHTGRATFARNFFEAGGVKAISNEGFADADAAANAFAQSGTGLVVICGSDSQYDELAEDFAKALKQQGAARIYLAGKAGDAAEAWAAAGIEDYVGMGGDVLAVCSAALDLLGVPASNSGEQN